MKQYFPKALIVADRFHVIRLINQLCMQTYQSLDDNIRYPRGLLGLLRTNPERLSAHKQVRLNQYLGTQPAIAAIYQFNVSSEIPRSTESFLA